jgi:membrane associated rhomboid family serine protease
MFFPYKDDNPRVLFPFVTFGIIILNVLIFLGQFWISSNDPDIGKSLVYMYGFVPAEFNPLTIFTSMFMHGGFAHIIGNMWFLYIFGDNVESILGHVKSQVPMIGASGAVAGVLGAYMIRFPKARVHVLAVIIIFITTFVVPAQIVLGLWFLMQLSGGLGSLGVDTTGGVAWFAHIGGFIIGVTSLKYFQNFRIE